MKDLIFDLTGKIALLRVSHGIGESIARLLASRGAHVIVSSRKIDACQAVADKASSLMVMCQRLCLSCGRYGSD